MSLTHLFRSLDVPIEEGLLLAHGINFSRMPFLLPTTGFL